MPNIISLRSIDVGFDLRLHKYTTEIPRDVTAVECEARHGYDGVTVTGTPEQIVRQLRFLGYRARLAKGDA
jgi:hypothetical protein